MRGARFLQQRHHALTVVVRFPQYEKDLRVDLAPLDQIDDAVLNEVILKTCAASTPSRKEVGCCGRIVDGHWFLRRATCIWTLEAGSKA